ncbi:hypothetical protein HOY80DRAFT_698941 [Tuber brumale]|nr:hypothetical protein HOY80DRAFT_698941 [Tuber brumale]
MSVKASPRPVVIVQGTPSSSTSSLVSATSTSSITRSNSISSTHSSDTSTSSASQHCVEGLGSRTRPARAVGGGREFVETGHPQGGNPRGGPPREENGYYRVSTTNVTVHNSGGQLTGSVSTDMGEAYANGSDHTENCRKLSQKSDNRTLCFCPVSPSS